MRRFNVECPQAARDGRTTTKATNGFQITLITPLFGGGVETKKSDPITCVRPTSIRGHLRFWWRATMGRGFENSAELLQHESAIWGDTRKASRVRIRVESVMPGNPLNGDIPADLRYILFPFNNAECRAALRDVSFTLCVDYPPDLEKDVAVAVTAWTNFGGLGSRTRRGCGALYCAQTAPESASALKTWWDDFQAKCPSYAGLRAWPVLSTAFMRKAAANADAAWQEGIRALRNFRQGPGFARDPVVGGSPGRSRWPEADSLRAHTGRAAPGHQHSKTIPNPKNRPAFPRAVLGLPIVFQFRASPGPGDQPNAGVLYPSSGDMDRMASPIILRPWKLRDNSVQALCVPLDAPVPEGVRYKFHDAHFNLWEVPGGKAPLFGNDLTTYRNSPMNGRSDAGLATEAFLHYLNTQSGYRKLV